MKDESLIEKHKDSKTGRKKDGEKERWIVVEWVVLVVVAVKDGFNLRAGLTPTNCQ